MRQTTVVLATMVLLALPALTQTTTKKPASEEAAKMAALAKAKTAALAVLATTSISCGDGSEGTCIRTDRDVISQVENIVNSSELWRQFDKVDATKADIILGFKVKNARTDNGYIGLDVRDADTNAVLWSESRSIVNLENDVTRLVAHFLKARANASSSPRRERN